MKKIEIGKQFISNHLDLFRCPICDQPFAEMTEFSLICPNGHGFDLSKKGTLYFLTHNSNNEYDAEMLSRAV